MCHARYQLGQERRPQWVNRVASGPSDGSCPAPNRESLQRLGSKWARIMGKVLIRVTLEIHSRRGYAIFDYQNVMLGGGALTEPVEGGELKPVQAELLQGPTQGAAHGSIPVPILASAGASKSPNVDHVLDKADALAREFRHHEVTLAHLMYALTMLPAACNRLKAPNIGLDVKKVRQV